MPPAPLISIVDDDDFLRNSLNNLLRSVGMRTHGFSSAAEFLNSNEFYDTDCLILDVRMPGMSGRIPIVFITSHADDDARARALAAGAVAFLYKPCKKETLLEAIDSALNHKVP
jgi:two-component system, LuxR family, response regulator FixJ